MIKLRPTHLRALFVLLPILLAVGTTHLLRPKPQTSLFALTADLNQRIPAAVRDYGSKQIQLICEGKTAEASREIADTLAGKLLQEPDVVVRYQADATTLSDCLEFYTTHAAGLMAPAVAEQLTSVTGRTHYAQTTLRQLVTSPLPPLVAPDKDPFGLLSGFLTSLPQQAVGWKLEDGVLCATLNNRHYTLVHLTLKDSLLSDTKVLTSTVERLLSLCQELRTSEAQIYLSGVPIHTALTAQTCRREIQQISVVSTLLILLLVAVALRSLRHLPAIALALIATTAGGYAILVLCCRTYHILALVFGSALLGLTVDYAFHCLLTNTARGQLLRSLGLSFLTTQATFLPLAFSGLPILEQIAIFMSGGLLFGVLTILFLFPKTLPTSSRESNLCLSRKVVYLLALVVAIPHLGAHLRTDLTALYQPPKTLLESERILHEISGGKLAPTGLLLVEGNDLESVLQREEALGLPESTPCLSRYLPSTRRRTQNLALATALFNEQGALWQRSLGLQLVTNCVVEPWQVNALPDSIASHFILTNDATKCCTLTPAVVPRDSWGEGATFFSPKQLLLEWLNAMSRRVMLLLGAVTGLVMLILVVATSWRALYLTLPSIIAISAVMSYLTLRGSAINLFHLLACFMVLGMSLDYSIFLSRHYRQAVKPVLCSLLTSLVGFGSLLYISFPLVQAIGITLVIGLSVGAISALSLFAPKPKDSNEQSASLVGLELAWLFYRLCGKWALDRVGNGIALVVWLTNSTVRKRTKRFGRLRLFVQMLIDKLVVMNGRVGTIHTNLFPSEDATALQEDISAQRGVVMIVSHLGGSEILAAIPTPPGLKVHAYMNLAVTSIFNRFYQRHQRLDHVEILPLQAFGIRETFQIGTWLDEGDLVIMAGDRGYGRSQPLTLGDQVVHFPIGIYRLAERSEHPVYFATCLRTASNRYTVHVKRVPPGTCHPQAFAEYLQPLIAEYPNQWFNNWEPPHA